MSASVSNPVSPTPTPERPAGVVVAAVVLALLAFCVLVAGGAIFLTAFLFPIPAGANPTAIRAILAAIGAGLVLFSGFCAWTVVDLFRMKRWAHISITVLGTLLALFSVLFSLLYVVLAFSTTTYLHKHPGISYINLKTLLLLSSGFWLAMALVGVWWLVYFSLSRTRRAFAGKGTGTELERAAAVKGVPDAASGAQQSVLGILVNCLAVLYLVAVLFEAGTALMHFPAMFFGYVFLGRSATITWITIAVVSLGMGIGLLRRVKAAWITAVVFDFLGAISELVMITPYGQEQMLKYQWEIHRIRATAIHPIAAPIMYFSVIAAVVVIGAVLWLLLKARPLFEEKQAS